MEAGQINTPRRKAAFLTTLAVESMWEYNIREIGDTRVYGGRGHVQLTGKGNYEAAGKWLGVDLIATPATPSNPDKALLLEYSAKIARWYWTVARSQCNTYADNLQMGKVNAAIGFPEGPGDNVRCRAFAEALRVLTGSVPDGITCTR